MAPNVATQYALLNAATIPCGRCEAKLNEPCVTLEGERAGEPHTVRLKPLEDAFLTGAGLESSFGSDGT